ncbi:MAG: ATP-binding protein, partial [Gemmatimonadota bacterium]
MDDLRLALVLNAVSPAIGGVLVRGEKGTAKSTMVRALAAVLPEVAAVTGCRFSCDPAAPDAGCPDGPHGPAAPAAARPARLVELPVGASEDRLVGALDIERALTEGVKAYEPGLLAAAHRGVLYVDEVNLLHDHLVDLLLDAAALGTCYVEREGVSVRHPARFLLVGTMNPEEGELRPQLLDRFGLTVEAAAPRDAGPRAEVIRRRLAYDADPAGFTAAWAEAENALADRIAAARQRLAGVVLPDSALRQVASVCAAFGVDGLRADLVTARAALAHAAWAGRPEVTAADIRAAARLALPHRRRRQPFDAPGLPEDELDQALADAMDDDGPDDDGPGDGDGSAGGDRSGRTGGAGDSAQPDSGRGRDRDPQRAGATAPGAHGDGTAGPGTPPAGAPDGPLAQRQPRAGEHGTGEGAAEPPAAAPGPV